MSIYGGFKIKAAVALGTSQLMLASLGFAGELINSTSIDVPLAKVQKQLTLQKDACAPEAALQCKKKYGADCICFKANVDLTRNFSRTIFLTVFKDTVVEYMDMRRTTNDNFVESYLPKVKEFAGGKSPGAVYVDSGGRSYETYGMSWQEDGVNYRVNASCPLAKYAGKYEMRTPLKACYQYGLMASRFREFPFTDWQKVKKEY